MCAKTLQQDDRHFPGWQPFEQLAERYDAWFDTERGARVFRVEAQCIGDLLVDRPRPWLEVGVGTGRFAAMLHVDEGVDPSSAVLRFASQRGIRTSVGKAEDLPYADHRFGAVVLVVTICFLKDPIRALAECRRILASNGSLVIGLVPKDSSWGQAYARKGEQGHPFYSAATFYTCGEIIRTAERAGFHLERSRSCLVEDIDAEVESYEPSVEDILGGAGFVGMAFGIKGKDEPST